MAPHEVPRLLISAVRRGDGRSTVMLALCHELRRRGTSVSTLIIRPQLSQAALLRRATGRYVRTLDPFLLTTEQNLATLREAALGADVVLVEGHAGLFDGQTPGALFGSDGELASAAGLPVILVLDSDRLGNTAAALLAGVATFESSVSVAGVILNRINDAVPGNGESVELTQVADFFRESFDAYGTPQLVGTLAEVPEWPPLPTLWVSERAERESLSWNSMALLGKELASSCNVEDVVDIGATAPPLEAAEPQVIGERRARIAVSEDSCFHLLFQDNLDLLRLQGAEIIPFSPLADVQLPDRIGMVYLSGASLSEYRAELVANTLLFESLRTFVDEGGVIYAEGGGCALLCSEIELEHGVVIAGLGLVQGRAVLREGAHSAFFDYIDCTTLDDSVLGRGGLTVKGIATHEWSVTLEDETPLILRCTTHKGEISSDGFSPGAQIFASFGFMHFGSCPEITKNLVDAAQVLTHFRREGDEEQK